MLRRDGVPAQAIFRAYPALRWLGGMMCAVAGLIGAGIASTGGSGVFIGPLVTVVYVGVGARVARVGVFETENHLLIRNRLRTQQVAAVWQAHLATV